MVIGKNKFKSVTPCLGAELYLGDCLAVMQDMQGNSVDSIVTDPPYGLKFMGKKWDHGVPGKSFWEQALRVAKPGAYMLVFGGTRTFHRLACAVEDAGWELRDTLMWVYGTGFPKSMDVSKALDKSVGAKRKSTGTASGHVDAGGNFDDDNYVWKPVYDRFDEPVTKQAKQWHGWGTALKTRMRSRLLFGTKPLEGTVAGNVLKYGVGGLNIDGCRIPAAGITNHSRGSQAAKSKGRYGDSKSQETHQTVGQMQGRFPANLIHDGSDEVTQLFPQNNPGCKSPSVVKCSSKFRPDQGRYQGQGAIYGDEGSASRFFYCAVW